MEGTLIEVIEKYQGKQLSANLPYKTQFMIPKEDGKEMKLVVHLVSHNLLSIHTSCVLYMLACCITVLN